MTKKLTIEKTPTSFFIPAAELVATYCSVSTDESRYYLRGVFVETSLHANYVQLVATNGNMLINMAVEDPAFVGQDCATETTADNAGFILSVDVQEKAFKAKTTGDLWIYGDTKTGIAQFVDYCGGGELADLARVGVCEFSRIEGSFPDWRRVMPKESDTTSCASFDPKFIAAVTKARDVMARAGSCSKDAPLQLHAGGGLDPMRVLIGGLTSFVSVIMPVRWRY